MSVQEPAWLKRTRPCPFFSQGRCLFADSCNFLHDVKVRCPANQPLCTTIQVKQLSLPPKPVFDPPSVVVNSASPRPASQSPETSVQDSSRYSGLLSVLSDIIGPPSDSPFTAEDAVPESRASPTIPFSIQNTARARTSLPSESDSFVTGIESAHAVAEAETGQSASGHSDGTLVDPYEYHVDPYSSQALLPVPDDEQSGDATAYFVEATYVVGSGGDGDDDDEEDVGEREEGPTMMSNRQSTLSSFTGASLLDTPSHSVFGEPSVASPIEDGAVDLLSPVQLSAKLRPFPIPSSRIKRGCSTDFGYAGGDSWAGPLPFPRSPPRSFQSSVSFPSRSRRDIGTLCPPAHNLIGVIREVECDGNSEDVEETILGAYGTSSPGQQVEDLAADNFQVNVETEEDGELSDVPAVTRSPRRYSPEHLRPTRECDLDSYNQPSFISDDNLSFKTALSTQPSYDDLSDISRASPVKQDLLPSISGYSVLDTSVLLQYRDADEPLEEPNIDSCVYESSCRDSQEVDNTGDPKAGPSADGLLQDELALDSDTLFAPASGSDLISGNVVAPQRTLSSVIPSDKCSPMSSPPVNASHDLSLAKDVLEHIPLSANDPPETTPEKVIIPREERSFGVFHFDKQPPKSDSPTEHSLGLSVNDALSPPPLAGDHLELGPENVAVPQEYLPHDGFRFDKHAVKSTPSAETTRDPFLVKDLISYASPGAQDYVLQERSPHVLHFTSPSAIPNLSTENVHSSSMVNNVPGYAANGDHSSSQDTFSTLLPDRLPSPSLVADHSLGSDEVTGCFDSEYDAFAQRLSFPLPPPFLPVEIVGHSTLSGEEDVSVLSEAAIAKPEGDVSTVYGVPQEEEMERIHLGFDLTEKALPSQLPLVGSPEPRADFTLRRSRATSDLTVKATSSPVIIPVDMLDKLSPPTEQPEQPDRSDSIQSLYDQYFDDESPEDGSDFSGPAYKDMAPPVVPNPNEEPSLEDCLEPLDLTPHVVQKVSALSPDNKPSNFGTSGTDPPRSETVLRPLLTGRKSFLRSSLAEFIPKANLANEEESSPTYPQTRLQVREIGSTMIPLGFRRHKPQPAVTYSPHPLYSVLPASELREVLRIRTDVAREDMPGCSSASRASFTTRSPLPEKAMSAPPTGGLRQLRLSSIINKRSSTLSTHSSSIASSTLSLDQLYNASTPQSPSVSSTTSFSRNSPLLSSCEQIPGEIHHTLKRSNPDFPTLPADDVYFEPQTSLTRRDSRSVSAPVQQPKHWRLSHYRAGSRNYTPAGGTRRISRRISTLSLSYAVDEEHETDGNDNDSTISRPAQSRLADACTRSASVLAAPIHAIATPKPNLLFAIASDDVDQVRQVLESGEAGPNDCVGPQSALAFTLTNDKLAHKQEIVKALLAYGANPSALRNPTLNPPPRIEEGDEPSDPPPETTLEGMDPATRYFVARADATHTRQTSQLIYRSFFRPLTRVRYDVIGQDLALEQLFRVLSIHSQKLAVAPIVVLLCGPSGHGKSLLARKFGSLLDVPTHTVNMTTLQSAHNIWQSYSMSPYEEPSSCTLAEFLIENEGKRCVVVLDEIEKVEDQKALWSLLMPWELGRCSLEAGKPHVDARNVIWLGTSNVGHELVFEYHENRAEPDKRMSREEYLELTDTLRPRVSHCLGASLVSRVTTVLPFVPFTLDEKKAIAAEAVYALAGNASKTLSPRDVESLVTKSLPSYHPGEGARSLHRAISNLLVDTI